MKIIGVTGKKRSGKDTFCQLLTTHPGLNVVRRAFADPLKEEVAAMLGVSLEFLEEFKVSHYRGLLQWWGTEFRREMFAQDYWLQRMRLFIDVLTETAPNSVLVITDCRFPNEAEFIREVGGSLVKVYRPSLVSTDTHASETMVDHIKADATIVNDGTLDEFYQKIIQTIPALL